MQGLELPITSKTKPWHYALAAGAVGLAFALRMVFAEYVVLTYILFYPAVMLAATVGGLGPGVLATAASALLACYWILEPAGSFTVEHPHDIIGLGLFTSMGLLISVGAERYRRALVRATRDEQVLIVKEREATALRLGEERLRALVENAADMIVVVDQEGRNQFVSHNMSQYLGRTSESAVGRLVYENVHPEDRPRLIQAFKTALATPSVVGRVTARFRHEDGSWRLFEAVGRNLLDDPAVRGVVINARDVTEQRRLEEQFHHAQKLESVGRLAGGVAHDFNNLLTVILSAAQEMKRGLDTSAPLDRDLVEDVDAAGERGRNLARQLLTFARKQVVAPSLLDLNEVIRGSESMLRRMLREDVRLDVVLQPGLWTTFCDQGQVEQVLMNLAVNARDAMVPAGGTLTIETENAEVGPAELAANPEEHLGQWVRLRVRDSGCGMSPEAKAHIFEPFFTTKPQGQGTGLGLATVHGIVSQSGGHIHVQSEPGLGTRFEVCFPRKSGPAEVPRSTPARGISVRGTETVLVVEDDPDVRDVMVRALRANGYDVLVAADGQEVRKLPDAQVAQLHLLVTDVVMPGQNGRQVAEELRRRCPGLPVLYMSGYTRDAFAEEGALDPRSGFLAKPFTAPILLGRVRELLDMG
jgi:two-component system cell cycle sensor histidine kinase/response regulator CckA